jgi:hypothetical protein
MINNIVFSFREDAPQQVAQFAGEHAKPGREKDQQNPMADSIAEKWIWKEQSALSVRH